MTTGAESASADPFAEVFSREDRDSGADTAAPEARVEPARDEHGRFAPKQPEAGTQKEAKTEELPPKASPEPETEDAGRRVPLRELLAERQKRKETEARIRDESDQRFKDYERRLSEMQRRLSQQQPEQEVSQPDPETDPAGAYAYLQNQLHLVQLSARADVSESLARKAHGNEAVDAALKAVPDSLRMQFVTAQDPYGALMAWHKQQTFLADVGDDPSAYIAKIEAAARAKVLAELKQGGAPSQKFPGSLASATQTGQTGQHIDPQAMADQIFDSNRNRRAY